MKKDAIGRANIVTNPMPSAVASGLASTKTKPIKTVMTTVDNVAKIPFLKCSSSLLK